MNDPNTWTDEQLDEKIGRMRRELAELHAIRRRRKYENGVNWQRADAKALQQYEARQRVGNQVAARRAEGKTFAQIAVELRLSVVTVTRKLYQLNESFVPPSARFAARKASNG